MARRTRTLKRNIARNNMAAQGYKSGVNRKLLPDTKDVGKKISFFSKYWRDFLVVKKKLLRRRNPKKIRSN